jgi:alpha-glucosidase
MIEKKQEPVKQLIDTKDTITGERYPDIYEIFTPNEVSDIQVVRDNDFLLQSDNGFALQVRVISDHIIRFRYAYEGRFEKDFSYMNDPDWSHQPSQITTQKETDYYSIQTETLDFRISLSDLRLTILDKAKQKMISQDDRPVSVRRTIHRGIDQVIISKVAAEGESYFGLGDKSGDTNLRGQKLQNWNTDSFGYEKDSDPLYRTVPFYYAVLDGLSYGIYFHNTYRSHFDFAKTDEKQVQFMAEGGSIDYYFIYGPSPLQVAQSYTRLTGTPEMPPLWALGFHQCRWSYYPEERVRELANQFREKQIPCDAIYLDIDYMDGYRCFTWNEEYFPDPKQLITDLKKDGFQTVVMIDPGIKVDKDYHVYKEGMEQDVFCYRSSGELMRGPVWPPDCVFPDFSNPEVRAWWGPLYKTLYNEQGVSGFWNDMNEPAVFKVNTATFPDDIVHHHDGHPANHKKVHNVYGLLMSRATFEGLKALQPDKRPFVLTRATASGGQRFASVWTGDNIASWEHLRLANIQCQRLSISGFSFVGTDIGGFNKQPDSELFVRWLQLAVFHPLYRVHSMGNNVDGAAEAEAEAIHEAERTNRMDQEPWSFGEKYTDQARKAIEFRYQLLPYLYTAFRQYIEEGTPVIRTLFMDYPSSDLTISSEEEFMFGPHMLVKPVLEAGVEQVATVFPEGNWYDYWTGEQHEGEQQKTIDVVADRIPVFVKPGSVVPNYPVQQYIGEQSFEEITLRVYYGQAISHLYEDAGEGYAYQQGDYRLRAFRTQLGKEQFTLKQEVEGRYEVSYSSFRVQLFGWSEAPTKAEADGKEVHIVARDHCYELQIEAGFNILKLA